MSSSKDVVAILTNAVSVAGREESGGMMKDQPISILVTGARNGNGQESQQRQLRVKYNDARVSPVWTDEQSSVELSTDSDEGSECGGSEKSSEGYLDLRVYDEGAGERNRIKVKGNTKFKSDVEEDSEHESDEEDEGGQTKWEYPEAKLPVEDRTYGVDERDLGTADCWVKRHPDMIRLTGRHPFNSEAPLQKLMSQGFLTPTNLHYVRNHGYVPQGVWDDWRIEITGRLRRPCSLSLNDLITKFTQRELPVTLVCAGNRRMEQNLVSKTIGFNWGPAGVSTSVWKGVRLCDVLRYCGLATKKKGALYVCFEGAETLPAAGGTRLVLL